MASAMAKTWATVAVGRSVPVSVPAPGMRQGWRWMRSSSTAVLRTARPVRGPSRHLRRRRDPHRRDPRVRHLGRLAGRPPPFLLRRLRRRPGPRRGLPPGLPTLPPRLRPRRRTPGTTRRRPRRILQRPRSKPQCTAGPEVAPRSWPLRWNRRKSDARAEQFIRELHFPADFVTTSDDLERGNRASTFFRKLVDSTTFQAYKFSTAVTASITTTGWRKSQDSELHLFNGAMGECLSSFGDR